MKKTLSVLLVLCLAFSMIAGTAVAAEKPDSNEDILNRLSKEYDIAISLATEEEMNILGFKPSANRKETRIDEAFIRDAIETNLKYTADATKKMSSGDWNEYKLSPGQTYVAVEEPFQTASATIGVTKQLLRPNIIPDLGRGN